jgi:hypothetical protein
MFGKKKEQQQFNPGMMPHGVPQGMSVDPFGQNPQAMQMSNAYQDLSPNALFNEVIKINKSLQGEIKELRTKLDTIMTDQQNMMAGIIEIHTILITPEPPKAEETKT